MFSMALGWVGVGVEVALGSFRSVGSDVLVGFELGDAPLLGPT